MKLKIGIPIGSLQNATIDMMRRAGYVVTVHPRSYYPSVDDEELEARLIRPQDMPRFVEKGVVDCGITGNDWTAENESDVHVVAEMTYSKQSLSPFRWVVAVPEDSDIRTVEDLQGKRISTELVNVVGKFLDRKGIRAEVEFSHGATESKAPDIVDAIVDGTETGSSLRANRMRIVETVMVSCTQLVACRESWADEWKRGKMEAMALLFNGAMAARLQVGLKMNVDKENLEAVLSALPSLKGPTVSPLANGVGYAVETVMDERVARDLIPQLRKSGATGIVEYPLNKVIP